MVSSIRQHTIYILFLLLSFLVLSNIIHLDFTPVKFILIVIVIFFFPGFLLYKILIEKRELDIICQLPVWFSLSLGALTIPIIISYIIPTTLDQLFYFIFILNLTLIIISIFKVKNHLKLKKPDWTSSLIVLIALLFGILLWKIGGHLGDDTLYHLILIKKTLARSIISRASAIYENISLDQSYDYGIWHLLLALLSKFSGIPHKIIWYIIPIILTPLSIISYYILAKTIFRSKITGFITSIILIFHLGGVIYSFVAFKELNHPYAVSRYILIPIIWLFLFLYIYKKKKNYFALVVFLPLTLCAVHAFYCFLYFITLFGFIIFNLFIEKKITENVKKIFLIILFSTIIIMPYIGLRYTAYSIKNPIFNDIQTLNVYSSWKNSIIPLGKNLFYVRPKYVFRQILVLFEEEPISPLIAFFLLPFLIFRLKKNVWASFLTGISLTIVLIMLFPPLTFLASKIISPYYIGRMSDILPTFLIFGFIISQIFIWIYNSKNIKIKLSMLSFIFLVVIVLIYISGKNIKKQISKTPDIKTIDKHPNVFDFLNDVKPPSVILSDTSTIVNCLHYANHYAMAVPPPWFPEDNDAFKRVEDVNRVLDPLTNIKIVVSILKRYNIGYILLNLKKRNGFYKKTSIRLKKNKNIFSQIYSDKQFVVFKFNK